MDFTTFDLFEAADLPEKVSSKSHAISIDLFSSKLPIWNGAKCFPELAKQT